MKSSRRTGAAGRSRPGQPQHRDGWFTAVDAASLLHEAHGGRPRVLPANDVLEALAWIVQFMRTHHGPRQKCDAPRSPFDELNRHLAAIARVLPTIYAGQALDRIKGAFDNFKDALAEFPGAMPRPKHGWQDTAEFLKEWYRANVDCSAGISRQGPLVRFIRLVFERANCSPVPEKAAIVP